MSRRKAASTQRHHIHPPRYDVQTRIHTPQNMSTTASQQREATVLPHMKVTKHNRNCDNKSRTRSRHLVRPSAATIHRQRSSTNPSLVQPCSELGVACVWPRSETVWTQRRPQLVQHSHGTLAQTSTRLHTHPFPPIRCAQQQQVGQVMSSGLILPLTHAQALTNKPS